MMVEATLPSSPAPQVTVTTTYTAAPLATSVAVLTLIEGSLLAVADARAAVAVQDGDDPQWLFIGRISD